MFYLCGIFTDKRRILFIISAALQTASLMAMGALGTAHDQTIPVRRGIVGMLLIYSFAWSMGWAPLTYVLSAELPSPPLREKTLLIAYTLKLVTE
jgi:SP family sugar:H+ symporter-like MFS transporter